MRKFDFMVQTRDDKIVVVKRSVEIPNSSSVWQFVIEIAQAIEEPGSLILVADEIGDVVIRTGIACARSLANPRGEIAA